MGVRAVEDDFHARFSCMERHYCYKIWNRSTPSALAPWRHWWMPRKLNIEAMQEASQYIIGEQDFTSFQATGCQSHSPIRDVRLVHVSQHDWEVCIEVQANAFLYHMVRNIVGNLVYVGIGKWDAEHIHTLLEKKNRSMAAPTAPAQGLYFMNAVYPEFSSRHLIGQEKH
jgi:tRNA pseudouridine38-40 synthase